MKKLLFVNIIVLFISCSRKNDELEIYSDVINNLKFSENITIIDSTTIGNDSFRHYTFSDFKKQINKLDSITFNDFILKNKFSSLLEKNFSTKKRINFISNSELQEVFEKNEDGWKEIEKKYGTNNSVLEFSKIGFNKSRTQAILYFSSSSGWRDGYKIIFFYEKKNGKWKVCGDLLLGIS